MEARELRIGNWVEVNGVQSEINYITPVTLGYGNTEFAPICTSMGKYFQPIPLTEEWFLKFGAVYNEGVYHLMGFEFLEYPSGFAILNIGVTFKSVHQLQNVIFALTGQELKKS